MFLLLFRIVFGFILESMFQTEGENHIQWIYDFYKVSAYLLCGAIAFLFLGMLTYRTLFHLAFLFCASSAIVAFLMDVYIGYTFDGEDASYTMSIIGLLFHLFIFNATLKNLSSIRIKKKLKPFRFL